MVYTGDSRNSQNCRNHNWVVEIAVCIHIGRSLQRNFPLSSNCRKRKLKEMGVFMIDDQFIGLLCVFSTK